MTETIEVKNSISDTVNSLSEICTEYKSIIDTLNLNKDLLESNIWIGEAKDKCIQINTLLLEYSSSIENSIDNLKKEVNNLQKNMTNFTATSENIRKISSI